MNDTLVLGLDGATFRVVDPLIEEGVMPNVRELRDGGSSGPLSSTMPPVTGPAWLSLATGRSPGQTGTYCFIQNDPEAEGYNFTYIEGSEFRGNAVWDRLSDEGLRVGVVDYPTFTQPYEIDGFLVCGGLGTGGYRYYPESLGESMRDLEKPTGHLDLKRDEYADPATFHEDVMENFERRRRVILRAIEQNEWRFCWAVVQETDWYQHLMWRCFDEDYPEAESVGERERELFREFWRAVDDFIGDCLDVVDDETNVVLQSDHGFGPMEDRSFRLNTWLKREGYLTPKSASGLQWTVKKSTRRALSRVAAATNLQQWAPRLFQWGRDRTSSLAIQFGAMDLDETKVFEPGHIGSMGGLYVNEAALDPGEDVDSVCREVTTKLKAFAEREGIPDLRVFRPEELYGNKAPGSPDMIVRIPGWLIEDGGWDEPIVDGKPERLSNQNGSHRVPGLLIATGPDFDAGRVEDAQVWDLAPTLLHLYGLGIPDSMDGEVLTEILSSSRDVERTAESGTVERRETVGSGDRGAMEEQLSDLGYLE